MEIKAKQIVQWMTLFNQKLHTHKDQLTELDQVLGDGDHGINMARGFSEVVKTLEDETYATVSDVLKDVAMTVISKVGGAAGPLYGTGFLKMSTTLKNEEKVNEVLFIESLAAGLAGIKQRGKSATGEKTLIDVWSPVIKTLQKNNTLNANTILKTARTALENTENITATKGRAAYFKEKSRGHLDPGATSSYYLFEALAEVVEKGDAS